LALDRLRAAYGLAPETTSRDDYIFTTADGGLIADHVLLKRHFYPLLRRAGLPPMPFHHLRHTAITHMIEDGVPLLAVSQMVGHANVATTMQLYGHLTPRMTDKAVAAMNARYPTRTLRVVS
jgi:integrase